ncbi:MAG: peptidoglycan DD-metalloendopeptidase family protein [Nitrospiraceae bacterium]|nr:MAG: peptidoglycan DD-metalloendopeptidase family protein [Nitrospiraceae bacterium]
MEVKQRRMKIALLPSCFFLLSLVSSLFFFSLTPLCASDPEGELKQIQKKIIEEKRKVEQTIKKEKSTLSELERITKKLEKKRKELDSYDRRLSKTRSNIRRLENDIFLLNSKLKTRSVLLKERLKSLYKQRHGSIADILVSARDNKDLMKKVKYISFIAAYDSKLMNTYSGEIKELNSKMEHMEMLRKDLETNKNTVQKKTSELRTERKNKDKLLASIKSKRSSYEKMINELEDSSQRLREMIKELEKKKASLPPKGIGFNKLKGRLPWPVYGEVLLPFGKQKDPQFNVVTYRKGIEIASDIGSAVLTVSEGQIVFADWFKGYGQLVIVNHGDGFHTLYANLAEIFHKAGDIIRKRQAVGKVGESGVLDAPSLYFEIRYKGKPLNPIDWLRKRKK